MNDQDFGGSVRGWSTDPVVRRDQLVTRILQEAMTPSERAGVKGEFRVKTLEESIFNWVIETVNSRNNLQVVVDDATEVVRKLAYDLGNA